MKNNILKKILLIAVMYVTALGVYSIILNPINKGKVMSSMKDAYTLRILDQNKYTNHAWTSSMFSGSPFINSFGSNVAAVPKVFFFSYCNFFNFSDSPYSNTDPIEFCMGMFISMFILLLVFKVNIYIAFVLSVIYPLIGYNLTSLEAGHLNKIGSYMSIPTLIAGIKLIFNKKYIWGVFLTVMSLVNILSYNHSQIIYYTFISVAIYMVVQMFYDLKEKKLVSNLKNYLIIGAVTIVCIGSVAQRSLVYYNVSSETMRGGSALKKETQKNGLDKDYAYSWSLGKLETFTFLFPSLYGNSSHYNIGKKSETFKALTKIGVDRRVATNITSNFPLYWGEMPFTSGPLYIGILIIFWFIFSIFFLKKKLKIWIFSSCIFFLILAWGKHLDIVNDIFRSYLPFYNKFRSVSMAVTILNILVFLSAGIGFNYFILSKNINKTKKALNYSSISLLLLGVLGLVAFPIFLSFEGVADKNLLNQIPESARDMVRSSIISDRINLLRIDAIKTILVTSIIYILCWLLIKNKIKNMLFFILFFILGTGEIVSFAKKYITKEDFSSKKTFNKRNIKRPVDIEITKDKDIHYRVLDITQNIFNSNYTSTFHKSIGGYSALKLSRYQDLIENGLSKDINFAVTKIKSNSNDFSKTRILNMLNTKYIIYGNNTNNFVENKYRYGNIWHVNEAIEVDNANDEIVLVNSINKNQLTYEKIFKSFVSSKTYVTDSSTYAKINYFSADTLKYEVFSPYKQLVVLSEIYFNSKNEWKAYVDGKEKKHFRANYCLRAIELPKGKHNIMFVFDPDYLSATMPYAKAMSYMVFLMFYSFLGYGIYLFIKKNYFGVKAEQTK